MAGMIGSEKIFENDKVIVWNFELQPGEVTLLHTHEHAYMWYSIHGAPLQVFDADDNDVGTLEVPTESIYSLKLESGYLEVLFEIGKGAPPPCIRRKMLAPSLTGKSSSNIRPDSYHGLNSRVPRLT
jgi:hypothetical protein